MYLKRIAKDDIENVSWKNNQHIHVDHSDLIF